MNEADFGVCLKHKNKHTHTDTILVKENSLSQQEG